MYCNWNQTHISMYWILLYVCWIGIWIMYAFEIWFEMLILCNFHDGIDSQENMFLRWSKHIFCDGVLSWNTIFPVSFETLTKFISWPWSLTKDKDSHEITSWRWALTKYHNSHEITSWRWALTKYHNSHEITSWRWSLTKYHNSHKISTWRWALTKYHNSHEISSWQGPLTKYHNSHEITLWRWPLTKYHKRTAMKMSMQTWRQCFFHEGDRHSELSWK
jgi:hypothetical protein